MKNSKIAALAGGVLLGALFLWKAGIDSKPSALNMHQLIVKPMERTAPSQTAIAKENSPNYYQMEREQDPYIQKRLQRKFQQLQQDYSIYLMERAKLQKALLYWQRTEWQVYRMDPQNYADFEQSSVGQESEQHIEQDFQKANQLLQQLYQKVQGEYQELQQESQAEAQRREQDESHKQPW